ncbi:MAG TPA: hypothetical protein VK009_09880 [Chloroflexota bacterium]|nr:hypothetical protein [Chloroflexota bacterium]
MAALEAPRAPPEAAAGFDAAVPVVPVVPVVPPTPEAAAAGLDAAVPPATPLAAAPAGLAEAEVFTAIEAVALPELLVVVTVPPQAAIASKEPEARSPRARFRAWCIEAIPPG